MDAFSGVPQEAAALRQGDCGALPGLRVPDERQHALPRQLRGALSLPVLRPGSGKADGGQAGERVEGAAARRLGEDRPRRGRRGGAILLGNARSHREDASAAVQGGAPGGPGNGILHGR